MARGTVVAGKSVARTGAGGGKRSTLFKLVKAGAAVSRFIPGAGGPVSLALDVASGVLAPGPGETDVVGFKGGKPAKGKKGGRFVSVGKAGRVGLVRRDGTVRVISTRATAHIGKNMPSHRQLTRLSRNLRRHVADAKTILKLAGLGHMLKGRGRKVRGYSGYRRGRRGAR